MIIPIPALWSRNKPADPNERIEQVLHNRTHRLIAGLSIDDSFETVSGALVVSVGHGKFLRLRHAVPVSTAIQASIGKNCRAFAAGELNDVSELAPLLSELADVQAVVVDQIKCQAGKYVDRVMAVAVYEPGLWTRDFDSRLSYTSFCDATRLAELSGVNVISSFPSRDLAVGGCGRSLDAIPLWMLAADRDQRVSVRQKFVLTTFEKTAIYYLPASDGLDADLPPIKRQSLAELDTNQQIVDATVQYLREFQLTNESNQFPELLVTSSGERESHLIESLSRRLPNVAVESISSLGFDSKMLPAIVAALLGLMHVDQMPANVPWLTGANSQRILGRLTPGRPASWRQLLRSMADFQPAAMKLKDAV